MTSRRDTSGETLVVLLTSVFDRIGGIHTFNRALIAALNSFAVKAKLRVNVLSLLDGRAGREVMSYTSCGQITFQGFQGHRARFAAAAVAAGWRADRVLFGHINLVPLASLMPRRSHLLVIHGIEAWDKLGAAKVLGMARAQDVLTVSRFTQRALTAANGTLPARFHWFPNTMDPFYAASDGSDLCREDLGLPGGPMVLTVTRLHQDEAYKRIDIAMRAMKQVVEQVPGAFYVVVGEGPLQPELQRLSRDLDISERVIFAGAVPAERLSGYYRTCDVFLLPSLREGFGIVFLEAMQFAKPCVGARAAAVPEVIEPNETGMLFEPDDVDELCSFVVQLLKDDALRQRLGSNGKRRLEAEFSFAAFRERLWQALQLGPAGIN